MIRVVLDTNILISALLSPLGSPAQVFLMIIIDPDVQLCTTYLEFLLGLRRFVVHAAWDS